MGRPLYEKYGFVKMEDEMAVSYTHLDVYKRQILHRKLELSHWTMNVWCDFFVIATRKMVIVLARVNI